jgi:hypothetical protein
MEVEVGMTGEAGYIRLAQYYLKNRIMVIVEWPGGMPSIIFIFRI